MKYDLDEHSMIILKPILTEIEFERIVTKKHIQEQAILNLTEIKKQEDEQLLISNVIASSLKNKLGILES